MASASPHLLAPHALKGMICAVFGFMAFSLQDVLMVKTTAFYPAIELIWFNAVVALGSLLLYLVLRKKAAGLKEVIGVGHRPVHMVRALLLAAGTVIALDAVRHVPLPNFYTIIFLGPLLAVVLSGIFLGEAVGGKKFLALLFGFAGLVIALRPGHEGFNPHALQVLLATLCFGGSAVFGRFLARKYIAMTLMFYPMLVLVAGLAVPVFLHFKPITPEHMGLVFLTACFSTFGFFINSIAYRLAPIYLIAPCQFLQFIWGSLAHVIMNKAFPEQQVILGAVMIIGGNLAILMLQLRAQKTNLS